MCYRLIEWRILWKNEHSDLLEMPIFCIADSLFSFLCDHDISIHCFYTIVSNSLYNEAEQFSNKKSNKKQTADGINQNSNKLHLSDNVSKRFQFGMAQGYP